MKKIQPLFILLSLTLTACGTASVAQRDATGGTIALSGGYMRAMREASVLMAERCQGRFVSSEHASAVSFQCVQAPKLGSAAATLAQR